MDSGPFTYVLGSHAHRFYGWDTKYRWSNQEMLSHYGESRIRHYVGDVGDVIVADTTGFHRGKKVISKERHMLTVNYQLAAEYDGTRPLIEARDIAALPEDQLLLADFLHVA